MHICHYRASSTPIIKFTLALMIGVLLAFSLLPPRRTFANDLDATMTPQLTPTPTLHSTIQRIRQRNNTLIAGVKYDFEPFGFINSSGDLVGFDVDLVRAMAALWGVNVQFVQVNSSNRLQLLATGAVDLVAASMTHTKAREAIVDFSQTYYLDGQSLLVRTNATITDANGLAGKTVAAIQGSTALDNIRELAQKKKLKVSVLPFQEYPPALAALKEGQVDALTTDSTYLLRAAQNNPGLSVVGAPFSNEPYGIGIQQNDSYFRDLINFTLQTLKTNGIYDKLYVKWFPGRPPYPLAIWPGQSSYTFATSPTLLEKPTQSRLNLIQARGKLLVGVKYDFPPFGAVDAQGKVQGFDVDIAHEFAARWLGDADAVELVPVLSNTRIPFLATGAVDLVIASMTHTQPRDDAIDFSETYFVDGQSLLVRKNSGVENLATLNGKTVAAVAGSTSLDNIVALTKARAIKIRMLTFQEYSSAVEALQAGQVDALTTDSVALAQFAKAEPDLTLVGEPFTQEPYAIGVPRFDSRFRNQVNATLQAMKLDGTYDGLYQKWFGNITPYPIELWPGTAPTLTRTLSGSALVTRVGATSTPTPIQRLILIPTSTPAAPLGNHQLILLPTNTPEPSANLILIRHRIVQGETLSTLALHYYGHYDLWTLIYAANQTTIGNDPNNLVAGIELVIPPAPP